MDQAQIKLLLTNLFSHDPISDAPCHPNQADIVAYVEVELEHGHAAAHNPVLQRQIATCASCHTLYTELKALLQLERTEQLVEPPSATFDLTFLQEKANAQAQVRNQTALAAPPTAARRQVDSLRWRVNELGHLLVALSAEFLETLQPAPKAAYLKAPVRNLFTVTSPPLGTDLGADLTVTLAVNTPRRQPEACIVNVTADIPSRGGWPNLGGITVKLALDDVTIATGTTDAFGKVAFAGIARTDLSRLQITVIS